MPEAISTLSTLLTDIFDSKEEAVAALSKYGLIPNDPDKQLCLYDPLYLYGNALCDPQKVEFVFVSADIPLRHFLRTISFELLAPFIFTSRENGGHYFAFKVSKNAFEHVENWVGKLLEGKGELEKDGFVFPLKTHWESFERCLADNRALPNSILKPDDKPYAFVPLDKVERYFDKRDACSNHFRLFDGFTYYFILKSD